MAVIFRQSALPSYFPTAPDFSFFEYRIAEEQLLNECFEKLDHGWWAYRFGAFEMKMHVPCWDADYDWQSAYEKALSKHKTSMAW